MIEAKILFDDINLKQTAILVAHNIADGKEPPTQVLEYDTHFSSQLFNITNAKRMMKEARKADDEAQEEVHQFKLTTAHDLADEYKAKIQGIFQSTFR